MLLSLEVYCLNVPPRKTISCLHYFQIHYQQRCKKQQHQDGDFMHKKHAEFLLHHPSCCYLAFFSSHVANFWDHEGFVLKVGKIQAYRIYFMFTKTTKIIHRSFSPSSKVTLAFLNLSPPPRQFCFF